MWPTEDPPVKYRGQTFLVFPSLKVKVAQLCPTLVTSRTVARQAPLSVGFSRQEYWSGLPRTPPGDLPHPGIKPQSPALQVDPLLLSHWGSPSYELI